jgi:hypothetical protein
MARENYYYRNFIIGMCVRTLSRCEVKVPQTCSITVGVPSRRGGGYFPLGQF